MTGKSPVWHPFTQHATTPAPISIARSDGAYLETADGRRIFDAISSWWVVTHSHRHPKIMAAIKAQADNLDQIIFAGFTHEPAEKLARQLVDVTPAGLDHVFYSDSGSTSVEVALKMALGYWRNLGMPRARIIAMEHAYHGDTTAAMSAGARGLFNAAYEPMLFEVDRIPFPRAGHEQSTLDALDAACRSGNAAALIVEPLILGAGGMLNYPAHVLASMKEICAHHGVLFIADEVMTGWGRTGTMFACEQAAIMPDIMCLSKGLTGGSLPLAVTMCSAAIFDAHASTDRAKTFFHSSSYTANPIACAAASANLDIWESEPVLERIAGLCALQAEFLGPFSRNPRLENVRQLGTITAVDLKVPDSGYLAAAGPRLTAEFLARGVLLRPLGNTLYVMPPYCASDADLKVVYAAITQAVESII